MSGPAGEEDDDATLAPCANATLIGHQAAEAALLSAIESGRPAHAWLFAGPRGIGKATLAYRFARYLLAGGRAASGPDLFGGEAAMMAGMKTRLAGYGFTALIVAWLVATVERKAAMANCPSLMRSGVVLTAAPLWAYKRA